MSDGIRQSYIDEHNRVMEQALALPLPDAVFKIIHYNDHYRQMGPRRHCDPIPLTVLHADNDPDDVEEWRVRARKLRNDAIAVGDASLRKDGSYDHLRAEFERKHPGFMFKTYEDAVGYGMFVTR